jgi:hypothetical protein
MPTAIGGQGADDKSALELQVCKRNTQHAPREWFARCVLFVYNDTRVTTIVSGRMTG